MRTFISIGIIISTILISCYKDNNWNPIWSNHPPKEFDSKVVTDWNEMFLILSKTTDGYRAPVAARVLAYMNWAAYEAVAPGMEKYQSIAQKYPTIKLPQFDANKNYHWNISANEAFYESIKKYVPLMDSIRRKQVDSLHQFHILKNILLCDTATYQLSLTFGKKTALAILAYADTDGGAKAYLENKPHDYNPPVGPDKWRRTFPDYLYGLTPYWGVNRPISGGMQTTEFVAPKPFRVDSSSAFFKEANEVYLSAKNISPTEKWIAEFWSDDVQYFTFDAASRMISITNQVIKKENFNLEDALYTTTKVGIGLFDGSIACWKAKYHFKLLRPVSYIRQFIDTTFRTNLNDLVKKEGDNVGITPAHPSYPSGHSTFGEVAATILSDIFGTNYSFTDRSHEGRTDFLSTPRSFKNFDEMAVENAYSRIPLGVHYRMDCDEGLRIGKIIGNKVNALPWKKPKSLL